MTGKGVRGECEGGGCEGRGCDGGGSKSTHDVAGKCHKMCPESDTKYITKHVHNSFSWAWW